MTPRALILDVVVRGLYPFMLVVSVWLVFRGHDQPGGGFIGGLVAVAGTALLSVALGSRRALARFPLARLPLSPVPLAAAGAILSLVSGLPALLSGEPFMTHLWVEVSLGSWSLDLSTVYLFDLGVFVTVWSSLGGLAAAIIGIDEEVAS